MRKYFFGTPYFCFGIFGTFCIFCIVLLFLFLSDGDQQTKNVVSLLLGLNKIHSMNDKSIYDTVWKAEEWFDDSEALKLCRAIEKQDIKTMEILIKSGVDVNTRGKVNMPLLLWAYPAGEKGLECLLKHGADPNFIIESSHNVPANILCPGMTLLTMAIQSTIYGGTKFRNYTDIFLKYGADVDAGDRPPIWCVFTNRTMLGSNDTEDAFREDILRKLIAHNADLNKCVEIYRPQQKYPVAIAASNTDYSLLLILLENGAEYDTATWSGAAMQQQLYRRYEEYKKNQEHLHNLQKNDKSKIKLIREIDKKNTKLLKVIKWLEEHGVSFDKPVSFNENLRKPEPFRVTKPKWQK
jgi:ankyrin repeat protein